MAPEGGGGRVDPDRVAAVLRHLPGVRAVEPGTRFDLGGGPSPGEWPAVWVGGRGPQRAFDAHFGPSGRWSTARRHVGQQTRPGSFIARLVLAAKAYADPPVSTAVDWRRFCDARRLALAALASLLPPPRPST